ncbi:MAG: hypothetical protein MK052_01050 [Alphaproteobacteria bacterium]|nr:hypothetical protein [Alphaproteobacteria bacterium]
MAVAAPIVPRVKGNFSHDGQEWVSLELSDSKNGGDKFYPAIVEKDTKQALYLDPQIDSASNTVTGARLMRKSAEGEFSEVPLDTIDAPLREILATSLESSAKSAGHNVEAEVPQAIRQGVDLKKERAIDAQVKDETRNFDPDLVLAQMMRNETSAQVRVETNCDGAPHPHTQELLSRRQEAVAAALDDSPSRMAERLINEVGTFLRDSDSPSADGFAEGVRRSQAPSSERER